MSLLDKHLLLINPWIYDFTAYDLWSKPLGLLYVASFLRQQGFKVSFIDCLDKYHNEKAPIIKKFGRGHFHREIVEKPGILKHVPRHYARYGMSETAFMNSLKRIPLPDAVLITSMMTYWYPGPERVVEIIRDTFPGVPVILGGVYATLLPAHARQVVKPDYLITGPGEIATLKLLCELFRLELTSFTIPENLDDFPYPAFDLLSHPDYLIVLTARGCPYNCSFCAQKLVSMPFTQRQPERVVEELSHHYRTFKIRDFAFYDDALFIRKEKHIKIILQKIIEKRLRLRFHAPNGLFANDIDAELAELMFRSGFKTICLSFETVNAARHGDMNNKISLDGMVQAVENLARAGFHRNDLEAYVIMGLPGQSLEEILSSMIFINNLGIQLRMASYSPIPGTKDFERACSDGLINSDIDPLLTNKTIFPLHQSSQDFNTFSQVRAFARLLNDACRKNFAPFANTPFGTGLKQSLKGMT
jgi:molybdenum cofactor biosynthesis enzyme MoaA